MRKLRLILLGLIAALVLLSGCTAQNSEKDNEVSQIINADIIIPARIPLNTESELSVKLSQGTDIVEDADDVQFEIWKVDTQEEIELIKAEYEKDGIYSIHVTFEENGLYYVQTHVTARAMHVMPKKQFVAGTATKEELEILEKNSQNQEAPSDNGDDRFHHH